MAKKTTKKSVQEIEEPKEVKHFDWGTIVLTCKCGHKQTLMEHVQHGIQFILTTNDSSAILLHCDKCGSGLKLHCEEGTPPPEAPEVDEASVETIKAEETPASEVAPAIEETPENENIQEESKEGESV